MTAKEALYRLIDELPEQELSIAQQMLEGLRDGTVDPVRLAFMTAPFDDEQETDEERAAVAEAREQLAHGETIADSELWRRLGHAPRQ